MVGFDYIGIGLALLVFSILIAKTSEGMFFSPACLFFVIFFLHAYVDPYYRQDFDLQFNFGNFEIMKTMVISANIILIGGYWMTLLASSHQGFYQTRIDPVFGKTSFYVATAIILLLFGVLFITMYRLGLFGEAKGSFRYDSSYKFAKALTYLFYSLVPAAWFSLYTDKRGPDRKVKLLIVLAIIFAAFIYTIGTFGRQFALFLGMTCLLIYHTRIKRMKIRHALIAFLGVLSITIFALMRKLRVGFTELRIQDIYELIASGGLSIDTIMRSILTAVPGQAVFSNVITIVDETGGYRYGSTYLDALGGILVPNTFSGIETETPALWYAQTYAPEVTSHGFDFSMFAEAYMNFGVYGVFVFFFVGMILAYCSTVVRISRNPVWIIWGSIMIVNLISSLRTDFTPFLTRAVYFIVPLLLLRYVSKQLLKPRQKTPVLKARHS